MEIKYLQFSEAIKESHGIGKKKQLLLGNGFSIGCHPSFEYGTLFEQAKKDGLSRRLEKLLNRYGSNFEVTLKYLDEGDFLAKFYGLKQPKESVRGMKADYEKLKRALVKTISDNHPAYPSEISAQKFASCLKFLKNFDAIFTVNYDLLLYWAALHINESEGQEFPFSDGFGRDNDPDDPDCSFSYTRLGDRPYLFFLHGALHLYTKDGHVWKRVWNTKKIPIIKQVSDAFKKKEYPLFVAEGFSTDKMKKIESSSYLSQAYRKFKNIEGHLFLFGHSLGEQDDHILHAITHAERLNLSYLCIGLHGDVKSRHNQEIVRRAYSMQHQRDKIIPSAKKKKGGGELNIAFFDTTSAEVWKN